MLGRKIDRCAICGEVIREAPYLTGALKKTEEGFYRNVMCCSKECLKVWRERSTGKEAMANATI